jgi:hypothetical protein
VNAPFPGEAVAVATTEQLSTQLGDEVVILGLQDSVYYGLTKVGARIWELLQTPRTLTDIVEAVVAEYDVAPEQAEADLQGLLIDLQARGLVAITTGSVRSATERRSAP